MSSHLPVLLPLATTRPNHSEYILSITPHQQQQQLVLTHPGPDISLVDAQSLKPLQVLRGGHVPGTTVSCVATAASTALDISTPGSSSASGVGDGGSSTIWSAGKDARVVRWDTRSAGNGNGGPEVTIKVNLRGQALPLTSLAAYHPQHPHLLICGTELASGSEAHLVYYDTRNPSSPLYVHSSTHSDDITQLRFLPPTRSFAPPGAAPSSDASTPDLLLLSASTDGLLALTNPLEEDEDEAFYGAAGELGGSVARMGTYWAPPSLASGSTKSKQYNLRVWARSDMDTFATFDVGRGQETGEVELQHRPVASTAGAISPGATDGVWPGETFRGRSLRLRGQVGDGAKKGRSSGVRDQSATVGEGADDGDADDAGAEESYGPVAAAAIKKRRGRVETDYLVDVCPTLGLGMTNSGHGEPAMVVGSNSGDIVLVHHHQPSRHHGGKASGGAPTTVSGSYLPSAYMLSPAGSDAAGGHGDVVRCLWHDVTTGALYTGAEDGTLCGWQLPNQDELLDLVNDHYATNRAGDIEDDEDEDEDEEMDVDDDQQLELSDADDEDLVWGGKEKDDGKRRRASGGGEVWGGGAAPGKRRRA